MNLAHLMQLKQMFASKSNHSDRQREKNGHATENNSECISISDRQRQHILQTYVVLYCTIGHVCNAFYIKLFQIQDTIEFDCKLRMTTAIQLGE